MDTIDKIRIDAMPIEELRTIVKETNIFEWPFIDRELGDYALARLERLTERIAVGEDER